MELETIITLAWLVAGVLLIGSEFIAPQLLVGFLGLASLLVAGGRWIGLIESLPLSFGVWAVSSMALVFALRGTAKRLLPGETNRATTDEELEAYGTVVEVLQACNDENAEGRIKFQGTTWPALAIEGKIEPGQKAHIVCRHKEGLGWVIEPVPLLTDGSPDED